MLKEYENIEKIITKMKDAIPKYNNKKASIEKTYSNERKKVEEANATLKKYIF